jgi:hypothetical protein
LVIEPSVMPAARRPFCGSMAFEYAYQIRAEAESIRRGVARE